MSEPCEILIVEDDPRDLELAVLTLRRARLVNQVRIARDGEEALDFLFCRGAHAGRPVEDDPRLVLMDLKLPKLDGAEVLRQIKSHPRTRAIPVVVLTASKEERDRVQEYQLGANAYVAKEETLDEFQKIVREVGLFWLVVNASALDACKPRGSRQSQDTPKPRTGDHS